MMKDQNNFSSDEPASSQCDRLRMTWEFEKPLGDDEKQVVEEHLFLCDDCRAWVREMEVLLTLAQQTPQYDVPEALTQRILSQLEQAQIEGSGKGIFSSSEFWLWGAAAIVGSWLLFGSDSFETESGSLAWVVAFVLIAACHYLLSRNGSEARHALQK